MQLLQLMQLLQIIVKYVDTALLQYDPTLSIGCNCIVDEKSR